MNDETITREKCLELAKEADFGLIEGCRGLLWFASEDDIESLVRDSVCFGLEMAIKALEENEQYYARDTIRKLAEEVQRV